MIPDIKALSELTREPGITLYNPNLNNLTDKLYIGYAVGATNNPISSSAGYGWIISIPGVNNLYTTQYFITANSNSLYYKTYLRRQLNGTWQNWIGTDNQKYSTSETIIGEWTDGKPIYRKVFNGNFDTKTTTPSTYWRWRENVSSLNISKIVNLSGYIDYLNQRSIINNETNILFVTSDKVIQVTTTQSAYENVDFVLCIEYTKTTD